MKIPLAIVVGAGFVATPVLACISASPGTEAWSRCAYAVAHKSDDHRFMMSMAEAVEKKKKLKPTSMPRWTKIKARIEAECGSYDDVAKVDRKLFKDATQTFIPETQFRAIRNTYEIDRRVKPNA